jgi:hypothetical protein
MIKRKIAVSDVSNKNDYLVDNTLSESLLLFFDHLQSSKGFKRTQSKMSVSNSVNGLVSVLSIDNSGILGSRMSRSS